MDSLSLSILSVLLPFSELFSKPSWKKALTLLLGTLLCTGKRTVCSALRAMGLSNESSFSKYHQLLNRTNWSLLKAGKILFFMIIKLIPDGEPIVLQVDETLERRKGKSIKAKGYYRDAVRSTKSQVVKALGLKWLVMTVSIKLPFTLRAFSLPFLTVLEPSRKCNERAGKRHKTTMRWTSQMLCQVHEWIDKSRKLILVGDGAFATGLLAANCLNMGVSLVTRLKMNARLFDFPPQKIPGKRGRPASRGQRLMNFKQMLLVEDLPWKELEVCGYNGIKRTVRFISNTCMWGVDEVGPLPIRWVLLIDPTGKLDPTPLMSTDPLMDPKQIIELYIERWGIEVTFEETREHLGVETQRQWSDKAIAHSTPILMSLYSIVYLMANRLKEEKPIQIQASSWYQKKHLTFSDMLRAVRMEIWKDNLIIKGKLHSSLENITPEGIQFMEAIVQRLLHAA